jgi:isopenicillin N synthase-like dioxygenase
MSTIDVSTLETRGYANVPYPIGLRAKVQEAVYAWKGFCALTNETKQLISYSGDKNVSGVGYELKLDQGATKDLKEDFHIRLTEQDFLDKEAKKVGLAATTFVDKAFELNVLVAPVIQEFAEAAESAFAMPDFVADVEEKHPRVLIRFLHYFGGRQSGDELAVPHVDKGGFTLHLYESHPGLEYLTKERTWSPMAFSGDETAIIPAMRLQYRAENRLKATCHRVVANEESARDGRFSVVCFVDFAKTPYYDKVRSGRLQDQLMGFNYNIPFTDFKKMFVEE